MVPAPQEAAISIADAQLAAIVKAAREHGAFRREEQAATSARGYLDDACPGERSDPRRNRDDLTVAVAELAAG